MCGSDLTGLRLHRPRTPPVAFGHGQLSVIIEMHAHFSSLTPWVQCLSEHM